MDWVVVFSGIAAGEFEDDFRAAGMGREEVCDIVDIAIKYDPAALWRAMLRNCTSLVFNCSRSACRKSHLPRHQISSSYCCPFTRTRKIMKIGFGGSYVQINIRYAPSRYGGQLPDTENRQ